MEQRKLRLRYYLLGFIPISVLLVTLGFFSLNFLTIMYFIIGFCWPFVLKTPGIEVLIEKPRYKYSFIRLNYRLFYILENKKENIYYKAIIRLLFPAVFSMAIFLYSKNGNPLLTFVGWGAWELSNFIFLKKNFK